MRVCVCVCVCDPLPFSIHVRVLNSVARAIYFYTFTNPYNLVFYLQFCIFTQFLILQSNSSSQCIYICLLDTQYLIVLHKTTTGAKNLPAFFPLYLPTSLPPFQIGVNVATHENFDSTVPTVLCSYIDKLNS